MKNKKGGKQKLEQRCAGAERFASGAYLFLELLGKPQTASRRSRENNPFCKGIKRRRGRKKKTRLQMELNAKRRGRLLIAPIASGN